jgi:hypothetical protein
MGIKSVLTKDQLKDITFEKLGLQFRRVILTEEQMDIAIDNALQKFFEEGDFGTEERYASHNIIKSVQDYKLPFEVVAVTEIIESNNIMDFFSMERTVIDSTIQQRPNQLRLIDIDMTRQYLQEARRMLQKKMPFDFNPITKQLHLHTPVNHSRNIVLKIYRSINEEDPNIDFGNVYGHQWIKEYTHALSMIQLADNLAMYGDTPLPNNMKVNYQYFLDRGEKLKEKLDTDLIDKYSGIPDFYIG